MLIQVKSTVALVDECYPSECVKFRTVLNPSHTRFRVNGTPTSDVEKPSARGVVEPSVDSLPLKPPKGKEQQTPTQSEQLSNGQNDSGAAYNEQLDEEPTSACEEAPARERDALDDIIDEARFVKDLVSCLKCFFVPN